HDPTCLAGLLEDAGCDNVCEAGVTPDRRSCSRCDQGFADPGGRAGLCPLCAGNWDVWELRLAPIPLERNRAQIASWLGQLPFPSAIDLVATGQGMRVRMFTPP